MIKLNEISFDYEPRRKILAKLSDALVDDYKNPEMSESESAFLCGMLKKFRPKKILEVGVAKGGTTSIILQALENLGESYEMYSVDISEQCYSFTKQRTGYMATFAKENNLITPSKSTLQGKHEFHIGKYLPQVIDKIGDNIDFVVLDTVHYTPGELLDFLVMLPYINNGAIVVLHDISLNQLNLRHHKPDAHATGLLLSTVTAPEKFLNSEKPNAKTLAYPNIAAFSVDSQTREHIENVFLALMLTWHYLPKDDELAIYREFYQKYYTSELVSIFDATVILNRNNVALKK